MRIIRKLSCTAALFLICGEAWPTITASVELTPADIPHGQLPNGYQFIIFNVSEGHWTRFVKLPSHPSDGDQVIAASSAKLRTYVLGENARMSPDNMYIQACGYCFFRYSKSEDRWDVSGTQIKHYGSERHSIPAGSWNMAFYDIKPGDSHSAIVLPGTAKSGDRIIIRSASERESAIDPAGLAYASSAKIKAGDEYVLLYFAELKKWVIEKSPVRELAPASTGQALSSPRSLILLTDNNWIPQIRLPQSAGDRDWIVVRSATSHASIIDGAGIRQTGMLGLSRGQEYTFMYNASRTRWEVVDSPDTIYTPAQLKDGTLPAPSTPRAIYVSDRHAYVPNIHLPLSAPKGSRILFRGEASNPFNVHLGDSFHSVRIGETPSFIRRGKYWELETVTVDVLGLYSGQAASLFGEDFMRGRLLAGIANTNEAFENSGANVRLNLIATRQVKAASSWKNLSDAYNGLISDARIHGLRDSLGADLVYYEGSEEERTAAGTDLCGMATGGIDASRAFGVGTVRCGTKVMQHEIGHLMTLAHPGEGSIYGEQGYPLAGTIMTGSFVRPFFSTPKRYTRDFGIPMGVRHKYDATETLNIVSETISSYRTR